MSLTEIKLGFDLKAQRRKKAQVTQRHKHPKIAVSSYELYLP
ncbi:hypothetical protein Hanom_Chr17g01588881 [Helianthus anomalus]